MIWYAMSTSRTGVTQAKWARTWVSVSETATYTAVEIARQRRGQPPAPALADVREEAVTRVDLILEPVVVEQPHERNVLEIVPDVHAEPAVIHVLHEEIASDEDHRVAGAGADSHVREVSDVFLALTRDR
jgi:hypothetical protein